MVGVLSSFGQDSALKSPKFQDVPNGTPGGTTRVLGLSNTGGTSDGQAVEEFTQAALQAWLGGTGGSANVILFSNEGGIEGAGISEANRIANWAALKTAVDTAQASNFNHLYFTSGVWEFQAGAAGDPIDETTYDFVPIDSDFIISGSGPGSTSLVFYDNDTFNVFRRQADNIHFGIKDIKIEAATEIDVVTVDIGTSTTQFNAVAHGLVNGTRVKVHNEATDLDLGGGFTGYISDQGSRSAAGGSYPADARAGDYFYVSVGGTIDTVTFNVGDYMVCKTAGSLVSAGWARGRMPDPIDFDRQASGNVYFVVNAAADTFELSDTLGGPANTLTNDGIGRHKVYELLYTTVYSSGYNIADDSSAESTVIFDNVIVEGFGAAILTTASASGNHIFTRDCLFKNITGVNIGAFSADGTEDVNLIRGTIHIDNCYFDNDRTYPFGNHFMYIHPHYATAITHSVFKNCWYFAVQFQNQSSTVRGIQQLINGNVFRNNRSHVIGSKNDFDRSALTISDNHFEQDGEVEFRSHVLIDGNTFRPARARAIAVVDSGTDKYVAKISNNTFHYFSNGNTSNTMVQLATQNAAIFHVEGNTFYIQKDLATNHTIFLGAIGKSAGVADVPRYFFKNNVYSLDSTDNLTGWSAFPCEAWFDGEFWDGSHAMVYTNGAGTEGVTNIDVANCVFDLEDAANPAERAAVSYGHADWTYTGRNNQFKNGAYIINGAGEIGSFHFRQGQSRDSVASAADVYLDPSFDSFQITGTTTINNIYVGASGNVAANAAAVNLQNMFSGSITLILPNAITLSAAGNIANGPYTTTGVEAVELQHSPGGAVWYIK